LLQNVNVLHANEAEVKKTTGEGRKLPGAVATLAAADAAGVVVQAAAVLFPSLLSPLFLYSAALSSAFFSLSALLLLCPFVAVSGGWRW
jgi:hypothetical protein